MKKEKDKLKNLRAITMKRNKSQETINSLLLLHTVLRHALLNNIPHCILTHTWDNCKKLKGRDWDNKKPQKGVIPKEEAANTLVVSMASHALAVNLGETQSHIVLYTLYILFYEVSHFKR